MQHANKLSALSWSLVYFPLLGSFLQGSEGPPCGPHAGKDCAADSQALANRDDPRAVAELERLATHLKRDKEGYVVEVNFRGADIDDLALAHLAGLRRIRSVLLNETSITDEGLSHLASLNRVKRLNLWRVPISDRGLEHLAGLTRLEWLNLDNTRVTDAGLPSLVRMNRLAFLHLGSTAVSDAGLQHLASLGALKDLKVTRTAVTADGVARLEQSLPECKIQLKYLDSPR